MTLRYQALFARMQNLIGISVKREEWRSLPVPLTEDERRFLRAFAVLVHQDGRRPSLSRLREVLNIGKGRVSDILVDLTLKDVVTVYEPRKTSWPHVRLHWWVWEAIGIARPVTQVAALPRALRKLTQPVGREVRCLCYKWFRLFSYWPEPRDVAHIMQITPATAQRWLAHWGDMGIVEYVSYRAEF